MEIKIYDIGGRCIKSKILADEDDSLSISVADIPSGTYFVAIKTQNQRTMRKFLVMR